jgi:hypothetical protein
MRWERCRGSPAEASPRAMNAATIAHQISFGRVSEPNRHRFLLFAARVHAFGVPFFLVMFLHFLHFSYFFMQSMKKYEKCKKCKNITKNCFRQRSCIISSVENAEVMGFSHSLIDYLVVE